ncbi:MAG TPA: hypothetical protein VIL66_07810 [Bacillota bacterium]|nr:hypothetical protein [Bacillota bacterium]
MNWEKFRLDFTLFLFNVFSVVAVFNIIEPFLPKDTATVTINSERIYVNIGWLWVFFCTLALVLLINILLLDRRRVLHIILGIFIGSLILLNTYTFPALVAIVSSFNNEGIKAAQKYIPHIAAVVGALISMALLKLYNKIFA